LDASLKFGITTPVVTLLPGTPAWEEAGGPEEIREVAVAADRLGYYSLTCSEHVGIPMDVAKVRGARYYDQLSTFGFIAALTRQIRLLTHIVVLPYHHPLEVAKRFGTLDRLSGGRLILGLGVGSLKQEFELLGASFDDRGARYDDAISALRASLGKRTPAYQGTFYRFENFVIDPCAVQDPVPLWLGGRTPKSLRRAVAVADGWVPITQIHPVRFGLSLEELSALVQEAREWPEWKARSRPFEIALGFEEPLDLEAPAQVEAARKQVDQMRAAGATVINVTLKASSAAHYVAQLESFKDKVISQFA
jgi:probable F420-dependent oxidoreductase